MIGMFAADWRTSLPLSKIEKIVEAGTDKHGQDRYRLFMEGQPSCEPSDLAYARIASTPLQPISANAAIAALAVGIDDGEHWVNPASVIGWARCFDGAIRVVTPAGIDDGHMWKEGHGDVRMPDGSVHSVAETSTSAGSTAWRPPSPTRSMPSRSGPKHLRLRVQQHDRRFRSG